MPCPLCGGLIHPIAGRCKHCKEDLSAMRAGKPQAASALPALNGHQVQASAPLPQMIQQARYEAAPMPVLPPRPSNSIYSLPTAKTRSLWKSWPMLVIVLASLAIVVAIGFMFWPPSADAGKHVLQPPPAPERMETNPLPPPGAGNSNGADPWGQPNGGGHSQNDVQPRQTPDPPQAPPPRNDPFGGLGGIGSLGGAGTTDVATGMLVHACKKLKACPGGADDDMLANACDSLSAFGVGQTQTNCDAAKQCFDAIDKMDCNGAGAMGSSPMAAATSIQACMTAMQSC